MPPKLIAEDVRAIATQFGQDPTLIMAVVLAEGDIVHAVECTFPNLNALAAKAGISPRAKALDITCRSASHAMYDFIRLMSDGTTQELSQYVSAGALDGAFILFWSKRWAPRGVSNDPKDLNKNWPINVLRLWRELRES